MLTCCGVYVFSSAGTSSQNLQSLIMGHRVDGKCSMGMSHVHFSRTFHILALQPLPSVQTNIVQRSIGEREVNPSLKEALMDLEKEGMFMYGQVTVCNL